MNIQAEKIELVKMLLDTENPKIIESIKKIFKKEEASDFWDDLSIEQRKEIEEASKSNIGDMIKAEIEEKEDE